MLLWLKFIMKNWIFFWFTKMTGFCQDSFSKCTRSWKSFANRWHFILMTRFAQLRTLLTQATMTFQAMQTAWFNFRPDTHVANWTVLKYLNPLSLSRLIKSMCLYHWISTTVQYVCVGFSLTHWHLVGRERENGRRKKAPIRRNANGYINALSQCKPNLILRQGSLFAPAAP